MSESNAHRILTEPGTKTLSCGTHGARVWRHHVMCDACGAVYHLDTQPRLAGDYCKCKRRLRPGAAGLAFTARPICYLCFRRIVQRAGGVVPAGHWTPDRDYQKEDIDQQTKPGD